MINLVNGVEIEMTPEEIAEWEAGQGTYEPPTLEEPPEIILQRAMLEEFTERMAINKTAPKHLKEAAMVVKARK